jgi:ABC-2 type transport system permease protein
VGEFVQETLALTRRWVIRTKRMPAELAFGLLQPLVWLLLFGNMFSKVATWRSDVFGTESYLTFQIAGILVMTVFGFLLTGGVPILFDRETGYLSRILAAPIPRASILTSRFLFLAGYGLAQCALILLVGWLMGVRIATGPAGIAMILLVCLLLGIGFTIISLAFAFIFPSHQVYFSVMGFVTTPVLFTSNALMPLEVMPGWLRVIALANPLTYACTAIRALILGHADAGTLALPLFGLVAFDVLAFVWGLRVLSNRPWVTEATLRRITT